MYSSTRRHVVTAANPASSSLPSSILGASVGGIGSRGGASGAGAGTGFIRYVDDVDEDEFSSNEENSDSDRVGPRMTAGAAGAPNSSASVPAKSRGKIPTNARVDLFFFLLFFKFILKSFFFNYSKEISNRNSSLC